MDSLNRLLTIFLICSLPYQFAAAQSHLYTSATGLEILFGKRTIAIEAAAFAGSVAGKTATLQSTGDNVDKSPSATNAGSLFASDKAMLPAHCTKIPVAIAPFAHTSAKPIKPIISINALPVITPSGISLLLTILVSASIIAAMHLRQKRNIRMATRALAGDLHDQLGPAIYYCSMLVKTHIRNGGCADNMKELQQCLQQTGETVRYLSHELRRNGQCTTAALCGTVTEVLARHHTLEGTHYTVQDYSKSSGLSHFQFAGLQRSLQELIHNSLRHAPGCGIHIAFAGNRQHLEINYHDTGKGFGQRGETGTGCGLSSIADRMEKMKGRMTVRNNYPDGYQIQLSVKL